MNRNIHTAFAICLLLTSFSISADVISFKDGFNGYFGTEDTYTSVVDHTTSFGASGGIEVQGSSFLQGLIRFNDIVGSGADQVAAGSTINSVTLSLTVYNTSGDNFTVNRLLTPFVETDTFSSAYGGDGASANDIEATVDDVILTSGNASSLDITTLASCWFDLSCANEGLVISNFLNQTDAIGFYSSNDTLVDYRPELIVDYSPAAVPGPASLFIFLTGLLMLVRMTGRDV